MLFRVPIGVPLRRETPMEQWLKILSVLVKLEAKLPIGSLASFGLIFC